MSTRKSTAVLVLFACLFLGQPTRAQEVDQGTRVLVRYLESHPQELHENFQGLTTCIVFTVRRARGLHREARPLAEFCRRLPRPALESPNERR